ncbi:hypothetical protein D9M69_729830 [compost metagenome]
MYPAGTKLREVGAGTQERVAFVEHIVNDQERCLGEIQCGQFRVFGECRLGMEQAEVVGIAFDLQPVEYRRRCAGLVAVTLLQHARQRHAPAQDTDQGERLARHERNQLESHGRQDRL